MFFHYSEVLDTSMKTEVQDEVEFTVMQVQTFCPVIAQSLLLFALVVL